MNEIPIKKVGMPLDEEGRHYDQYPGDYSITRVQEDLKNLREAFAAWHMDMEDRLKDSQDFVNNSRELGFDQLLSHFDKLVDDLEWKG